MKYELFIQTETESWTTKVNSQKELEERMYYALKRGWKVTITSLTK